MWIRAFISTTFSSVSFYTCPCKSTITKTTEKNIISYFIFLYIVSHHFKKMYKFGTFFLFIFKIAYGFDLLLVFAFEHMFFLDTNVRHSFKINCNVEISGHAVVRTLDYSSCPWPLAIRGVIRLAE